MRAVIACDRTPHSIIVRMPWFAVRSIFLARQKTDGTNIFEERVCAFEAESTDAAHVKAQIESERYASANGFELFPEREAYEQDGEPLIDGYEVWSALYEGRQTLREFYELRYLRFEYQPDATDATLPDGSTIGPLQLEWEAERDRIRPQLLREIEFAFDGVELGTGISLNQARAMDDYESEDRIRLAREWDTELRWQDIPDDKVDRLSDTLAFMDSEGFRFYIPRFMTFALRNERSSSHAVETTVYWTARENRIEKHMALLSDDQRTALDAFADFFGEGR
jgi:hypothetical protein